jgi:Flp pilus assembly protein TadB
MADLDRRPNRTPRRQREQRAYALTLATGGFAVVAVVGLLLALFGVVGAGLPLLAAVIAVVCGFVLRRTVAP